MWPCRSRPEPLPPLKVLTIKFGLFQQTPRQPLAAAGMDLLESCSLKSKLCCSWTAGWDEQGKDAASAPKAPDPVVRKHGPDDQRIHQRRCRAASLMGA